MKRFRDLIGEAVEIEWKRDPASVVFVEAWSKFGVRSIDDGWIRLQQMPVVEAWSKFRVRSIDDGWIRLQQMPEDDGAEPDPHPFWARLDSIDTISEMEEWRDE